MQGPQPGACPQRLAACRRKRVTQPGDDLRHRQIDVRDPRAEHPAAAGRVAFCNPFEIVEELRQARSTEVPGAALALALLLLVVQAAAERMMGVVDLDD